MKKQNQTTYRMKCDHGYLPAFPQTELGYAVHSSGPLAQVSRLSSALWLDAVTSPLLYSIFLRRFKRPRRLHDGSGSERLDIRYEIH